MKEFLYYRKSKGLIKVFSSKKPSRKNMTRDGLWVLEEWDSKTGKWVSPCFCQVTLYTLNRMQYVGELKKHKEGLI